MSQKKGLSPLFWVLISLVIIVAIVLVVGILSENTDVFKNLWTFQWSQPESTLQTPNIPQCKLVKEVEIPLTQKLTFAAWDDGQLAFWASLENSTTAMRVKMLDTTGTDKFQIAESFEVPCSNAKCTIDRLKVVDNKKLFFTLKSGEEFTTVPGIRTGEGAKNQIQFKSAIGRCGKSWDENSYFFEIGLTLYVIEPKTSLLGQYEVPPGREFHGNEIPVAPTNLYHLDAAGFLSPYDCRNPITTKELRGYNFSGSQLVLFPEPIAWGEYSFAMYSFLMGRIQGPQTIRGKSLGVSQIDSMSRSGDQLLIASESSGGKERLNSIFSVKTANWTKMYEVADFQQLRWGTNYNPGLSAFVETGVKKPYVAVYDSLATKPTWMKATQLSHEPDPELPFFVLHKGQTGFEFYYQDEDKAKVQFAEVECHQQL